MEYKVDHLMKIIFLVLIEELNVLIGMFYEIVHKFYPSKEYHYNKSFKKLVMFLKVIK